MRRGNEQTVLCKAVNVELVRFLFTPVPRYSLTEAGCMYPFLLGQYFVSARKEGQGLGGDAFAFAKNSGVHATSSAPAYSIVEPIVQAGISHNIDLIVLGSKGPSGFKKLLISSVSSAVVNHAHCPVLVAKYTT
jgi:nucleotide-binding universal stress UspA family protein